MSPAQGEVWRRRKDLCVGPRTACLSGDAITVYFLSLSPGT